MNRFFVTIYKNFNNALPTLFRRNASTTSFIPFHESFLRFSENDAVIDNAGTFKYKDILSSSYLLANKIKTLFPDCRNHSQRIAFMCNNDATYVSIMLACWITGNTAVPLCNTHPQPMLEYYVQDSQSKLIIANNKYLQPIQNIAAKLDTAFFLVDHDILKSTVNGDYKKSEFFTWDSTLEHKDALIIYTSGTTGRPKGVVLTHGILYAQTKAVIESWEISSNDSILHSLPLHHIHGIMNALLCLLRAGGMIVMQQKFDAAEAWKYFLKVENEKPAVNLFFAVPTMYAKLLKEFEAISGIEHNTKEKCLKNMRLMSSGSQALPVPTFFMWENITGHRLLERFGMSEIGMAMCNPLHGLRQPGSVGTPMPHVEVKIQKIEDNSKKYIDLVVANDKEIKIVHGCEGDAGELMIRGPNVFKKYWNREEATVESFTNDGWFHTGDTACFESGGFKILGRTSVDIIKSGGYKISALEVESCLLQHTHISECTVFGIPDEIWGERVTALILLNKGKTLNETELRIWCKQYLPPYAIPTVIKTTDNIPRNVMGKVNKKELKTKFIQ